MAAAALAVLREHAGGLPAYVTRDGRSSRIQPALAGNLLIYNKKTLKKQSIAGKHVKTITSGAWHSGNKLILASADRQVPAA